MRGDPAKVTKVNQGEGDALSWGKREGKVT